LVSLLANPNSNDIQPLSFSPLYGIAGTPDGTRIVKAPKKTGEKPRDATLEVQPISHSGIDFDIRIKVRYP
jgi:hypothetical protein